MTDCNYCKQSPQSLQPGCCTETRVFPAAQRGSADHDQAAQQRAFAGGPASPRGCGATAQLPRAGFAAFCPVPVRGSGRGCLAAGLWQREGTDGMCNALGHTPAEDTHSRLCLQRAETTPHRPTGTRSADC